MAKYGYEKAYATGRKIQKVSTGKNEIFSTFFGKCYLEEKRFLKRFFFCLSSKLLCAWVLFSKKADGPNLHLAGEGMEWKGGGVQDTATSMINDQPRHASQSYQDAYHQVLIISLRSSAISTNCY